LDVEALRELDSGCVIWPSGCVKWRTPAAMKMIGSLKPIGRGTV